jgi:hypothetical protein
MPDRPEPPPAPPLEPNQDPLLLPEPLRLLLEYLGYIAEVYYTVEVINSTADTTFDEIDVFYKRVGQSGIVFLTQKLVAPGETRYFNLGPCSQMESYVVGFFVGADLVAQVPPEGQGNITPDTKPDAEPCADSWTISDN